MTPSFQTEVFVLQLVSKNVLVTGPRLKNTWKRERARDRREYEKEKRVEEVWM